MLVEGLGSFMVGMMVMVVHGEGDGEGDVRKANGGPFW